MIKKSSLQRVARYAGVVLLTGAVVGCGDDDGGTPIDGGIDAPVAEVDACVGGHGCEGIMSPFQLPEGGEIRFERFQQNADDTQHVLAAQAFFFKGQDPLARPVQGEAITLRTELQQQGYSCGNFTSGVIFNGGKSPEAQAIVDTRDYYDVGANVTLTNTEDDTDVVTLTKITDPTMAIDLSAQLTHDILYRGDPTGDVERNTTYKPAIPGTSLEYPELALKFGESMVQEELANEAGDGDPLLYMPSTFTLTEPAEADYFQALTFTKGEDFTIRYEAEEKPEGWPTIVMFIGFVNPQAKVVAFCAKFPTAPGDNPDDGEFIVPREVLELVSTDPGVVILGRFTHAAWEYQQDKTRIDLLGIECKQSPPITIQEAPPAN